MDEAPKITLVLPAVRRRPSEVFCRRLREARDAADLTQAELARLMAEAGRPLGRAAIVNLETVTGDERRRLTLDEALALSLILGRSLASMLAPEDDGLVWIRDDLPLDGDGIAEHLTHGFLTREAFAARLRAEIIALFEEQARALMRVLAQPPVNMDALKAARDALTMIARRYEEEITELERELGS